MSERPDTLYKFESFLIDPRKRLFYREGRVVPLTQKCFDVLLALVERAGETVEKDELMCRVWPDTVVEESNLTQTVSMLRKALGESRAERRFIVTVQGRGYRFVAEVEEAAAGATEAGAPGGRVPEERRQEREEIFSPPDWMDPAAPPPAARPFEPAPAAGHSGAWPRARVAAVAVGVLLAVAGSLYFSRRPSTQAPPAAERRAVKSIAVLPFKPLAPGGRDEYLETGMADALITRLSNISDVNVRPTSAVTRYGGGDADSLTAGRELGVDAVLEGSVQRADERVRVTARLLSVGGGEPLWAATFDEEEAHIFDLQDAISVSVARSLVPHLAGEDRGLFARRHTESGEAYQAYLRGRYFWNRRTEEGLQKGVEHFERATQLDPSYALAYAGLADCYVLLALDRHDERAAQDYFLRAKAAALKAIELDDRLAEAHTSLALVHGAYDRDERAADAEYRRAIELNPDYATARHWYAWHWLVLGRVDRAIEELERARASDPVSLIISADLAKCYYFARRYDAAVEASVRALEMDENFVPARAVLGMAYEQKGMLREAVAELERAHRQSGGSGETMASLAHAYARAGDAARARRLAAELAALSRSRRVSPLAVSAAYSGLGDRRQAAAWAGRAQEAKDVMLFLLRLDPRLEGIAPADRG